MRILFITPTPLWPLTSGGRQRTLLLHRALRELGEVEVAMLDRQEAGQPVKELPPESEGVHVQLRTPPLRRGERGLWRCVRGLRPALVDRLAHNLGRRSVDYSPDPSVAPAVAELIQRRGYDVVVGRYLLASVKCGVLGGAVPVVVDVDDVDFHLYLLRIQQSPSALARLVLGHQLRQVRTQTKRWLTRATVALLANPHDQSLVAHPRLMVLPNIPFPDQQCLTEPMPPGAEARRVVLMVGTWNYPANVQGLDRFLVKSWPAVRERTGDARLRIVGAGMSDSLRRRWGAIPGVEAVGYVDDLAAAYRDSGFTIAPIREGGGSKIKVLESLMHGRTMAATPHALRGFEESLRPDQGVLVAEGDAELAAACVRLLQEPATSDRLARTGRAQVLARHSYAAFAAVVRDAVACASAGFRPRADREGL
jgi:glycosyltransferase involved in cell wall biosynthesis